MPMCQKCNNTGSIDTGNNDLPCDCSVGDTAQFNQAGVDGVITGKQVKKHFLNGSPEPISTGQEKIPASCIPV